MEGKSGGMGAAAIGRPLLVAGLSGRQGVRSHAGPTVGGLWRIVGSPGGSLEASRPQNIHRTRRPGVGGGDGWLKGESVSPTQGTARLLAGASRSGGGNSALPVRVLPLDGHF